MSDHSTLRYRPATAPAVATPIDLRPYVNAVGIEPEARPGAGGFNIWRNSFPAGQLPIGQRVLLRGVPFDFPDADGRRRDHVQCRGQRVALAAGGTRVDWLYLVGAAERRTEDVVRVHYIDGGERAQWLRLSDFWPETGARFGEALAYRTTTMLYPRHVQQRMRPSLWAQRIPVAVPHGVSGFTLPDNPAMHVLALTTVQSRWSA